MPKSIESLPDVLTPADLIDVLPIGRNSVYDLIARREIASVRCGKKIMIPKQALEAFLGLRSEAGMSHV